MKPTTAAFRLPSRALFAGAALGAAALTAGCQDQGSVRSLRPLSSETIALFEQKGVRSTSPTLIRAYKKEAEFEVWKQKPDGTYVHVKTFPMCRWSGQLGPKKREGDRQVPEGFYSIGPGQMNPNSNYYLSFNVGYPNAYDRAHGYSGALIMVHGACSSAGCFSMTDEQIAEIYAIARESFAGGQRSIQMQSMPFRMTAENLAKHRLDPNMDFWRELKRGADMFDVTHREPTVGVCNARYAFNMDADACSPTQPEIASRVAAKAQRDEQEVAELTAKIKPVKVIYADGGQHPSFRMAGGGHEVSRPDALAQGPTEIELEDRTKAKRPAAVAIAAAKPVAPTPGTPAAQAVAASAAASAQPAAAPAVTTLARAGAAKPVALRPAVTASVAPAPAVAAAEQVETQAFYKRWLGYGSAPEKSAAASAVEAPAVAPTPAARPLALSSAGAKPAVRSAPPRAPQAPAPLVAEEPAED
jgi:murein L,D-transpeptidase YafK